ncbi:MAG: CYTH domain-containing protein, partial [Myxococcota bacterium]
MSLEREIKLMLDPKGWAQIRQWATEQSLLVKEVTQTNHYFDTPTLAMADLRLMLRLRHKHDRWEMTFKMKLPTTELAAAQESIEVEQPIDAELAQALLAGDLTLADQTLEPIEALRVRGAEHGLQLSELSPIGAMTTHRTLIRTPDGPWTMELDHSHYLGLDDYELECEADDMAAAFRSVSALLDTLGVV